ncbi:MAG TPA: 4-hydroxy-tetrahydrodipicolinate reductase [Allosphingosinicella sp.]|nr:4-hydroxy-tetrahydrodipicolinate reductase [Allosphingosinicella sp.]
MTGIGILGSAGRMGLAIAKAIEDFPDARLAGGAGRDDDVVALARNADVLIDFSTPDALHGHLDSAMAASVPIVIGTTGLNGDQDKAIEAAAARIPVLQSANMSLGVNLLAFLVRETAARLGADWDIEIVEMHHRHKVDAPSGTALLLGAAAATGRGVALEQVSDRGRDGITGEREAGHIGFAALRGGSVPGDHLAIFAGEGERIELGHRAESRDIFARGAIRAALWLKDRPKGRYSMKDVLGLG